MTDTALWRMPLAGRSLGNLPVHFHLQSKDNRRVLSREMILVLVISVLVLFVSAREVWLFYRWLRTTTMARSNHRKMLQRSPYASGSGLLR
jgi:hypothetical protein